MPECQACGAHISAQFKRVFAGPDGEVHACRECADRDALLNGAAAHPAPN